MKSIAFGVITALILTVPLHAGPRKQAELDRASTQALNDATNCCLDYSQLEYVSVVSGEHVKYRHDRKLPAMLIDGKKSFVKALKLPKAGPIKSLWLEARSTGSWMLVTNSVVVYPSVLFLDDHFRVISTRVDMEYRFTSPMTSSDGMEIEIELSAQEQMAKYVLIYTDPSHDDGKFHFCRGSMGVMMTAGGALPIGGGNLCFDMPYANEGKAGYRVR